MYDAETGLMRASVRRSTRLVRWLGALGAAVAVGVVALGVTVLLDAYADAWERAEQASANLALALKHDFARNLASYDLSIQGVIAAFLNGDIQAL